MGPVFSTQFDILTAVDKGKQQGFKFPNNINEHTREQCEVTLQSRARSSKAQSLQNSVFEPLSKRV